MLGRTFPEKNSKKQILISLSRKDERKTRKKQGSSWQIEARGILQFSSFFSVVYNLSPKKWPKNTFGGISLQKARPFSDYDILSIEFPLKIDLPFL